MEGVSLKDKFDQKNKEISDLNYLLNKFHNNIKKIKDNQIIQNIQKFNSSYEQYYCNYTGLKRFSIPVFGKISSGKSTLLNYILNLHGLFETNYNISTKFICIVRHNPNLTEGPKIFNVTISERGNYKDHKDNKTIKLWNFEKGDEIMGNIKEIISNRNHELEKLEFRHSNWEKYFLILETNIPLFKDSNKIYSELFEFMDVPGLNEFTGDNDINKQFYYKDLIPFFIYNVGFSLYIFDAEKQESEDSISIINNIMNQYFNNDPDKQKNSIFILNKIDKITKEKEELENFKLILEKNLICHIEKKGFFIGLSGLLLYLKRFKYESFFDYLICIIEEYNNNEKKSLEEYLVKKMSDDFKVTIEENLNIDDDEQELPVEQKNTLNIINNKAIKKGFKGELSEGNYIYYNEYFIKLSKNKKEELGEKHQNFESLLIKSFKNTIDNYFDNFKDMNLFNKLMKELELSQDDLKNGMEIQNNSNPSLEDPFSLIKSLKKIIDSLTKLEPKEKFIQDLSNEYKDTLLNMEQKRIRIPLLGEYSSGKSSLLNTLIGNNLNILPVDTKVCTNIAVVIKYIKDQNNISLYHTFLEKTSRGFYIFKSEKNPIAKGVNTIKSVLNLLNVLYSSADISEAFQNNILQFVNNLQNKNEEDRIYFIDNLTKILNNEISLEKIKDNSLKQTLRTLFSIPKNSFIENDDFFKRAFFLITIPIETYDIINLPDNIKETIELIDFPGLDSTHNIFKSNVLEHLIQFSDGFIFVNKGNSILELEKANILKYIINKVQDRKFEFTFKSCLFVLNRCDEVEINIENCKKEYEKILEINKKEKTWNEIIATSNKLKDSNNINITKFSNKLYFEFINFITRLNDYDNYLKDYENNINKKFEGKKFLMYLKKKVYEDVTTVSVEKYKSFKNKPVNTMKYEEHFKNFLKNEEIKPIISDIIKMYLFMKNSIYDSKFYEKSNAKDFFEKFKNQIVISKLFYEESLKKILIMYIVELNQTFEILKLNILNDKIVLKFSREDFIQSKNNLNEKLKKKKNKFLPLIDSKFELMKEEYDKLIKDFKDGNFESYKKSIEITSEKINDISKDLEKMINNEIKDFQEDLCKELEFIERNLKELSMNKNANINDDKLFDSIENAERSVFGVAGGILYGAGQLVGLLGMVVAEGAVATPLGLGALVYFFQHTTLSAITSGLTTCAATGGIIGASLLGLAGLVHGGFCLYKKFTEKDKYIELIEKEKKELNYSCSNCKTKVKSVLKDMKNQIELAVEKFEEILFSKKEGIKNNKEEWMKLYKSFKNLISMIFKIKEK